MSFLDAFAGVAVGDKGVILSTTDGGSTWNPQTPPVTTSLNGVHCSDASGGWAVGDKGVILRLTFAPTAVALTSFGATPSAGGILVEWETASEVDTLGFNVYRGDAPGGGHVRVNSTLIPGQTPGSREGAAYSFRDDSVRAGTTYFFWLEVRDVGGGATLYGPTSATVNCHIYLPLASTSR